MRVFVSTYGIYNSGRLSGEWVDLEDFDSYNEFIDYCIELFDGESEVELMFQDRDSDVPDWAYSKYEINENLWEYLSLSDEDKLKVNFLYEYLNYDIKEALRFYDNVTFYENMTLKEVAEELVDEGFFGDVSDKLKYYIDFEKLAKDLELDDYYETPDGVFFMNY
jgi:hypothetical protein